MDGEPLYDFAVDGSVADVLTFVRGRVSRTLLDAALVYASRGWQVFPLHSMERGQCTCCRADCDRQGKHPLGKLALHGLKDATTDADAIISWWARFPGANIAIRTGAVSSLVVIDIDPQHGGEKSLEKLIAAGHHFATPLQVRTGGGGRHLYFQHPRGECEVRNSAGTLGPGLDVRGDNGFVVAPPSCTNKGRYAWL